ncbi:hypothetical protein V2J09_021268 [Rumex salicifolius]
MRKNPARQGEEPTTENASTSAKEGRREAILKMTSSSAFLLLSDAVFPRLSRAYAADGEDLRTYTDDTTKYKIVIPTDWQVGSGESDGVRSLTAFYPQQSTTSNVSVLITGLGPDFTRLESFGKVDAFAETLVSGLDRSWQRPAGVSAKLIDYKASKGLYYIEYTLQNPGESLRHIYSALGVANTGWYNRLYTVTGQFFEEEADVYGSKIEKAVQSFTFIN